MINQFTSSLIVTMMGMDRYLVVCHPILAHRYRSAKRAEIACLSAWIVALILMAPHVRMSILLQTRKSYAKKTFESEGILILSKQTIFVLDSGDYCGPDWPE